MKKITSLFLTAAAVGFASCNDITVNGAKASKGNEWEMDTVSHTLKHHESTADQGKVTTKDTTFTFEGAQKDPVAKEVLKELTTQMKIENHKKKYPAPCAD